MKNTKTAVLLFLSAMMHHDKKIWIAGDQWTALEESRFFHATDGAEADCATTVQLKADEAFLTVAFECAHDPFVAENYLFGHNEPLYNQEVFEVFIAAGKNDPVEYLEVEINPNDAIWVGKITNPSLGAGGETRTQLIGHEESGIRHSVEKGKNHWKGTLSIPWVLVADRKEVHYRINFYRIVSKKSHPDRNWVGTKDDCDFLCWSPTLSGAAPAFHRPKRFGELVLSEK